MLHGISLICISPKISCLKKKNAQHYSSYPTLNLHKSTSLNLDASFPPMVFRSFGFLFKKNVLLMAMIASYERVFDILHPRLYKGWTIFLPQNMVKNGKWIYHQDSFFFKDRWKFSTKTPMIILGEKGLTFFRFLQAQTDVTKVTRPNTQRSEASPFTWIFDGNIGSPFLRTKGCLCFFSFWKVVFCRWNIVEMVGLTY